MSFRGRLRLFFTLIVIVPLIALGVVLFGLAGRSETGKADAGIATGTRAAAGLYREEAARARSALHRVAGERDLHRALARDEIATARRWLRTIVGAEIVAAELWAPDGRRLARAGSTEAVASAGSEMVAGDRGSYALTVSVTDADDLIARVHRLTGHEVVLERGGRLLGATMPGASARELPPRHAPSRFRVDGQDFRGRFVTLDAPMGPPVELGVMRDASTFAENIAGNRVVIACFLALFVLLALVSAAFVSRALTGQIATLLEAARRLSRGDFRHPIPVEGRDEFAELGREFNDMSLQLEAKIEEVERKRAELAETIRRVGDALATGLDRRGVVALAVRQAVDACDAEVGRALPLARGAFSRYDAGSVSGELAEAIEAAERDVFAVRADVGTELLSALEGEDTGERTRRTVSVEVNGVHALAIGLRSLADGPEYLGAISIARRGKPFSHEEEDLLEYLAGQVVVSIENASLHETIERQAVTDELTGLANVRAFLAALDTELERSRRFDTPLALVMVDIDNFKAVNDTHGHQQGDEVLAQVAGVLRDMSRDLDTAARYGGEELAVVLPQTDAAGAAQVAERMRAAIEALQVPSVGGGEPLTVTASLGVAGVPEDAQSRSELVAAADGALYCAKRAGKNRVERAGSPVAETSSRPR